MSDKETSPQSVDEEGLRDAVAWLERAFPKDAVGFSTSYRPTMTAVQTVLSALSAAPAPSSLAGGGVTMGQRAFEAMRNANRPRDHREWSDLTDDQRNAWNDDATERPHLYGLAALSPEAPAQDVRKPDEMTENALRSRAKALLKLKGWRAGDKIHIHGMIELLTQFGMDVSESPEEDRCNHPECGCDFDEVCDAALTPRHEAPDATLDKRMSPSPSQIADAADAKHEAPAEGAGEDSPITAAIRAKLAKVKATNYFPGTPAQSMKPGKIDGLNTALAIAMVEDERALRARSSAPEAREGEAVAWRWRFTADAYGVDGATPGEWKYQEAREQVSAAGQWRVEQQPLYTQPAAPSADRLRIAAEALEASLEYAPPLSLAPKIRQALAALKDGDQ